MFERIEVLGVTDYTFTLTAQAKARGWDAAFGAGVVRVKEGRSGRGERRQTTLRHLNVPVRLPLEIEVAGTERWLSRSIVERVQPQKIAVGSASISSSKEPTSELGSMRT